MKSEENIDLNVTQDGLKFSGIYSLKMQDENNRKRMYASLVIVNSLANFFMQQNLNVSNTKNIYKVAKLSEEFEITDLYVNNWRLDIRLAMPDDTFYIPISHFENEILPDYYVVATIDKELKTPKFVGYVAPKNLKYEKFNSLYYKSGFEELKDMSDLLQELREVNNFVEKEKDHKFFNTKILSYLDDEADNFTKNKLIHHILNCQACRTELINFCGFDMIASKLENYSDLFEDESLNIIGALDVQDDETEDEQEKKHQEEQAEREERIQNLKREKNDVLIDGLFENTPKPIKNEKKNENITYDTTEINQPVIEDIKDIKLDEDDVFSQDVPTLEETIAQKDNTPTEIVFEKGNDNTVPEEKPQKRMSLADSLKEIPDEMFNTEYESKSRKQSIKNKSSRNITEKVIVDYDEFGQPIYGEEKSEDYTIVESDYEDMFTKDEEDSPDVTDTFSKNSNEKVIESSGENVAEELISKIPPQAKQEKPKTHYLSILILGLTLISSIYFFVFQPNMNKNAKNNNSDVVKTVGENGLDDAIVKNINSKTGYVKLKSLNWVVQKSLLGDSDFKSYLQVADKRFKAKFKLNSNSVTQAPFNNNIVVEAILTPEGIIKTSRIAQSSGVKAIDEAIILSLKEATNSIPIPEATQKTYKLDEYYLKLVIKL